MGIASAMKHVALILMLLGVVGAQPWLPVSQQTANLPRSSREQPSKGTQPPVRATAAAGPGTAPRPSSSSSSSTPAVASTISQHPSSASHAGGNSQKGNSQKSSNSPVVKSGSQITQQNKPTGAGGKQKVTEQGDPPSGSSSSNSSSSSDLCSRPRTQPGPWALSAIEADSSGLSAKTDRVLICLVSSGIVPSNPFISHNSLDGCGKEDPLDPGGCVLRWDSPDDSKGNWKKRGTLLTALMAASGSVDTRVRGVLPEKAEVYVVPVYLELGAAYGALDPDAIATGGTSRLRAYSACEGRLRGLQSQDWGLMPPAPSKWRMVMLVDVAQTKTTSSVGSDFPVTEAEWFTAATDVSQGSPGDILVVAAAGDDPSTNKVAYPAAINQVLAVAAYGCNGEPLRNYSDAGSKPDMLAPGLDIPLPAVKKGPTDVLSTSREVESWSAAPSHAAAAYVAAAAARLWNEHPECSAEYIKRALLESSQQRGPQRGQPPRLDLKKASNYMKQFKCPVA